MGNTPNSKGYGLASPDPHHLMALLQDTNPASQWKPLTLIQKDSKSGLPKALKHMTLDYRSPLGLGIELRLSVKDGPDNDPWSSVQLDPCDYGYCFTGSKGPEIYEVNLTRALCSDDSGLFPVEISCSDDVKGFVSFSNP